MLEAAQQAARCGAVATAAGKYKRLGLVLSGGGARGAYQVGVWKAMHEAGLHRRVQAVAGTSIGAINAALFLQGDVALAEEAWLTVQPHQVLSWDPKTTLRQLLQRFHAGPRDWLHELARIGLFTRSGLNELIDRYIDLELISKSAVPAWVACRRLNPAFAPSYPWDLAAAGPVHYFRLNYEPPERIRSYLLASSAIPLVFGAEIIGGFEYADGGIGFPAEHTPVKPVYDFGCDLIVVVYTEQTQSIDVERFRGARIVEVSPRRFLGGARSTFDFSQEGIRRRMALGYADAQPVVESLLPLLETEPESDRSVKTAGAKQGALQRLRALLRRGRNGARPRRAPKAPKSKRSRG